MKPRIPDHIALISNSKTLSAIGGTLTSGDISASVSLTDRGTLKADLTADKTPVSYLRLRWNFSEEEVRRDLVKVYGDVWERSYGDLEWRGIVPERCMPWVCAVSNGSDQNPDTSGRFTECFGVKTQPGAMCFWQYDTHGLTLWLDVRCGGVGVTLGGRTLDVCEIVFGEYRDMSAFSALKSYYSRLCDHPLLPDHKVYGTNNWYYAYGRITHDSVINDTKLLTRLCAGIPNRPYMVIDAGWDKNGSTAPWNELREGRFSDMKALADEMRELGARPGIWVRPLRDKVRAVFPEGHAARSNRDPEFLDPSHPETLSFVKETIDLLCSQGYELIKHDFTTFDALGFWGFERKREFAADGWSFYDRSKTTAEIFIGLNKAILEASAGRALILGCDVIGHLAAGLVHLNRTGDDTSGKDWERVRKYGINTLAFRQLHHGSFYESDADCVGIMGLIDWKLNSRWLDAVAHSGTPLFVSPDPEIELSEDELKRAYQVNSVQSDTLIPLDWMENVCPERWLLNGAEKRFDWYPDSFGSALFG